MHAPAHEPPPRSRSLRRLARPSPRGPRAGRPCPASAGLRFARTRTPEEQLVTTDSTPPPSELPPSEEMATAYDASQVEERVYAVRGKQSGCVPPLRAASEPFTDHHAAAQPHRASCTLGHALVVAVRGHADPLASHARRRHAVAAGRRPRGDRREHAGGARARATRGRTRHEIGRDAFLERVWQFVNRSRDPASPSQHRQPRRLRRLGAARSFTMDPRPASGRCARRSGSLFDDGLIYRGEYIVNWCVRLSKHRALRPGGRPRATSDGSLLARPLPRARRRTAPRPASTS